MNRYNAMLSYVPLYYHSSNIFKAILQTEGTEFDSLRTDIEDMKKQLYVDTATWGLSFWESEYGLPENSTLSYEERRARLKGKIRGIGKVSSSLIQNITQAYSNGETSVEFDDSIKVTFIGTRGIPKEIETIKKQVSDIAPAHLEVEYLFTYLSWSEFDLLSAEMQESMTWAELEVFKPFGNSSARLVWDEFDRLALQVQEGMTWDEVQLFKQ